jgi:uncharacterized protein YndB with AHSA1/START domain
VPVASKPSTRISTPSDREITMTRVFNAPRDMVFDAWTKPELLKRWFGPPGWELVVCEIDLRVGGAWRFVGNHRGHQMTLRGTYRTVARPDLLIHTQQMEGCSGQGDAESLITLAFVEKDGKTTFTSTSLYPSREVRDRVLTSGGGSSEGMDQVFDRLADLLAALAS